MSQFLDIMKKRRSTYTINNASPISDDAIEQIVADANLHVPSSFNMHSGKTALLLGNHHKKLWSIVLETLRKIVPPDQFQATEERIAGFAAGHGTVLFFNDENVVTTMENNVPAYAHNFKNWAAQGNGMLQYAIWCLLTEAGLGASLQHYNPLIDNEVKKEWSIPAHYSLLAQMPFGTPTAEAGPKEFPEKETLFRRFD